MSHSLVDYPSRLDRTMDSGHSEASEPSESRTNFPRPVEEVGKLPKIIQFDTLARCGEEIWIENNGQLYRLRRTRQGKLILTK